MRSVSLAESIATMTLLSPRSPNALAPQAALVACQAAAFDRALGAVREHDAIFIAGAAGAGKTLVIDHLQRRLGGRILRVEDAFHAYAQRDPAAMEEALIDLLTQAHADHDIVFFDDLGMASVPSQDSDRPGYSDQLLRAYLEGLRSRGKTLIVSWDGRNGERYGSGFTSIDIGRFGADEYRAVLEHHAGQALDAVDFDRLHRAYRELSGSALAFIGRLIRVEHWRSVTTDAIMAIADEFLARTNIDLAEVAPVSLDTLVGIEPLVETLERSVLIPMLQPELARELGLRPKRGILLHGAPGTGKTTIGRALARRMKGKFFMIDGTVMPGDQFYQKFDRIMTEAVRSSPAVIFIDDADVLFRNGEMMGLARLLLSKLDGLESETQSQICMVMTAMDVADMPPAMVRSGRVEVWLEMCLPDADRRIAMIHHFAVGLAEATEAFDQTRIVAATQDFTPADLRGLIGDVRGHLAYDRHRGEPARSFEDYLLLAAAEIGERKAVLRAIGSR